MSLHRLLQWLELCLIAIINRTVGELGELIKNVKIWSTNSVLNRQEVFVFGLHSLWSTREENLRTDWSDADIQLRGRERIGDVLRKRIPRVLKRNLGRWLEEAVIGSAGSWIYCMGSRLRVDLSFFREQCQYMSFACVSLLSGSRFSLILASLPRLTFRELARGNTAHPLPILMLWTSSASHSPLHFCVLFAHLKPYWLFKINKQADVCHTFTRLCKQNGNAIALRVSINKKKRSTFINEVHVELTPMLTKNSHAGVITRIRESRLGSQDQFECVLMLLCVPCIVSGFERFTHKPRFQGLSLTPLNVHRQHADLLIAFKAFSESLHLAGDLVYQ